MLQLLCTYDPQLSQGLTVDEKRHTWLARHRCIPVLCLQCGRAGCVYCISFLVPECRTDRHPVSPVPERKKCCHLNLSGSGIRGPCSVPECSGYRAERADAGMPMPAASTSMPMPSYDYWLPSSAKGTPARAGMSATVGSPTIELASAGTPTAEEMRETVWT
jgi:hypothetical protein